MMTNKKRTSAHVSRSLVGLILSSVSVLTLASMEISVLAAERSRHMAVMPARILDNGNELTVSLKMGVVHFNELDAPKAKVGAKPDICFSSKESGFISIWSHDALKNVSRILPNEYIKAANDEKGYRVEAGKDYCYSELPGKSFLQVGEPLGEAQIYFHFTTGLDQQFSAIDLPSIGNRSAKGSGAQYDHDYASKAVTYEVVE